MSNSSNWRSRNAKTATTTSFFANLMSDENVATTTMTMATTTKITRMTMTAMKMKTTKTTQQSTVGKI